jgi:hypothetical protein
MGNTRYNGSDVINSLLDLYFFGHLRQTSRYHRMLARFVVRKLSASVQRPSLGGGVTP